MGIGLAGRMDLKMASHHSIDLPLGLLVGAPVTLAVSCGAEQLAFYAPDDRALAGRGGLGQAVKKGQAIFWPLTRKGLR